MSFPSLEPSSLQRISSFLVNPKQIDVNKILNDKANSSLKILKKYTEVSRWIRFVYWIKGWEDPRIAGIVRFVKDHLIQLEPQGVELLATEFKNKAEEEEAKFYYQSYSQRIKPYTTAFNRVEAWMQTFKGRAISSGFKKEFEELKQHTIGLRYRVGVALEDQTIGLKKAENYQQDDYDFLLQQATQWKEKDRWAKEEQGWLARKLDSLWKNEGDWVEYYQKRAQATGDRTYIEPNELEKEQLKKAAKYPEWVALMRQQFEQEKNKAKKLGKVTVSVPKQLKAFFNFAFQNDCSVSWFIKYQATQQFVKKSLLASSLGRPTRQPDKKGRRAYTKKESAVPGVVKKVPSLQISKNSFQEERENTEAFTVNLADPHETIYFEKGNYKLSVWELGCLWTQRKLREVNINFDITGLNNEHTYLGRFDADLQAYETAQLKRNMTRDNWLDFVPEVDEVSNEIVENWFKNSEVNINRWSDDPNDEREMFFTWVSTRQTPTRNSLNSHSFLRFYVRKKGEKSWKVKAPGVYAEEFQQGLKDGVVKFGSTMGRHFHRTDQNDSYSFRESIEAFSYANKEKCKELCLAIYDDLITSEGVFQFAADENCTGSFQKVLEKVFGRMPKFIERNYLKMIEKQDGGVIYKDPESPEIQAILQEVADDMLEKIQWKKLSAELLEQEKKKITQKIDEIKQKINDARKEGVSYQDPIQIFGFPNLSRLNATKTEIGVKQFDSVTAFLYRYKLDWLGVPALVHAFGGFRQKTIQVLQNGRLTNVVKSMKLCYNECYKEYGKYILYSPSRVHDKAAKALFDPNKKDHILNDRVRSTHGYSDIRERRFGIKIEP